MPHHRPALRMERATKWNEWVAMRRDIKRICRLKKVTFVAINRVGVGPGVKTDSQREVKNDAMLIAVCAELRIVLPVESVVGIRGGTESQKIEQSKHKLRRILM